MSRQSKTPFLKAITASNYLKQFKAWISLSPLNFFTIIFSAAGLILAIVLSILIISKHNIQQQKLIDTYSMALTQLGTNQLRIPLSIDNLIGLQSVLDDLIDQPRVINAVIYNIDNKIIVQASKNSLLDNSTFKAFTAPITLDKDLLGSLTINIDNSIISSALLLSALLCLFLGLLALFFYKISIDHRAQKRNQEPDGYNDKIITSKRNDPKDLKVTSHNTYQSFLLIHFHTLEKLYQQLNAELKEKELVKLDATLKNILTFYSGKKIAVTSNSLLIKFESISQRDSISNALFSAHLLSKHGNENNWLLHFSNFIFDANESTPTQDLIALQSLYKKNRKNEIIIKEKIVTDNKLHKEIESEQNLASGYLFINGFSEKYQRLLNKQSKKLL